LIRDLNLLIRKNACVIFIGSLLEKIPHATSLVYDVTKSVLHALSKNIVNEFNSRIVTVNVVAPQFVKIEWQKTKANEIRNSIYSKTALGKFATVNEVSNVCIMIIKNNYNDWSILDINVGYDFK